MDEPSDASSAECVQPPNRQWLRKGRRSQPMTPATILILGGEDDDHAVAMLHYLHERNHDAELLDSRWFPARMTLTLSPGGIGAMRLPSGRSLQFDEIKSVYWRSYQ